ncbi:HAMP domain-containing protein [Desulforamulus putei DSM 12395]|uniref:histidine kinase n=1 Tax=Desulforamulus putei DSM 12395 TaxID=1121429 RepID=A0A1M4T9H8_9FIRM|nr:ATP-binding protein [Desulforamulus putei]SHE41156.1 HAMP domain-containing protein [Desulforamulus putei DSM 12395]
MKQGGIVKKLWTATALLVLLTLGIATLTQLWLLQKTYYRQQVDRLLEGARGAADAIATDNGTEAVYLQLEGLAGSLQATVFLLNTEGQIIHSTSGSGWGRGMMHGMGMGPRGFGHGMREQFAQVDMDEILAGRPVIYRGHHPMFNTEVITVAAPIEKDGSVMGAVVVNTPLQPIDANLRALQGVSIYSLLFGLLLAALFSWFLSRSLSKPLLQMQEVAKSMAQGDYSKRVRISRDDEIGWLAESLNTLSRELEEKISLLRRVDETRRDFVARVSHELRTPLTIIQGNAEALLDRVVEDPAKQREYLNNILEETLRLRRLANELLDLRKIETGEVDLYKERVDAVSLFTGVVQRMQGLAAEREIHLRLETPQQAVIVEADTDRLGQILINLIENALRFSPAGGEVLVKLMEGKNEIIAEVRDNGPGIPEDEQKFIWDKFYKVDKSRSRSVSGTGLGLAIVKHLVELHGGAVTLFSKPGQGTTFRFTIPK